jgi:peroxiredoxin
MALIDRRKIILGCAGAWMLAISCGCNSQSDPSDSERREARDTIHAVPQIDPDALRREREAAGDLSDANVDGGPKSAPVTPGVATDRSVKPNVPPVDPPKQDNPPIDPPIDSSAPVVAPADPRAELLAAPYMPETILSSAHEATSLVRVGDAMPELSLVDDAGQTKKLAEFFGRRLTLVVFWRADEPYHVEELSDLGSLIVEPFEKHGVRVVSVGVEASDSPDVKFPALLDPSGDAWSKISTSGGSHAPRTFLLDASGKILWFDVEYSRSTRRDMVQGVLFQLRDKK